ncbi:TPA: hypothetical protein ACXILR_003065 [Proteus mirabilis]
MKKLIREFLRVILSVEKITNPIIGGNDQKSKDEKEALDNKDNFFVGRDGSISLNPNSIVVQKSFKDNIEKLQSTKGR